MTAISVTIRFTRRIDVSGKVHFLTILGRPLAVCVIAKPRRVRAVAGPGKYPILEGSDHAMTSESSWDKRYFCSQCPPHSQPKDGFTVDGLVDHANSHTILYLREALTTAHRYHGAIEELQANRNIGAQYNWPAFRLLQFIDLCIMRTLGPDDDAAWEVWKNKYNIETPPCCPTCGRGGEK